MPQNCRISTGVRTPHARRSGWRVGAKAAGLVTCVALALGGQASVAAAQPWFRETDIATITPSVAGCGKTSHKPRNIGGEATAVFDVNGDGIPDIVIVNGTDYYFVALGHRNPNGTVSYPKDATPYRIGLMGDDRIAKSKALGLTDFNRDGKLDLYIGNSGNGSLDLKNPRGLANAYNPANLDTSHLCEYHGYRTYVNKGNGMFGYKNVGADVNGDTRTPLFADFDGNGTQDMLAFNAPYYGIWWGSSNAPNSLLPGRRNGTFAGNILQNAIVGAHGQPERNLFQNRYGQAIVDVKGAVVRDFDGDGKPDVIAAAYSDVWDGIQKPPLAPASAAGARVDLNHDGIPDGGWQGAWPHGIIALDNISKPGRIRFRDESATATDEGLGFGDRMDAYETIPVDLNHDGKLDLVAIGIRNFTGFDSLRYQTPIIKVYKNVSTPGHLHFVDVTKHSGLNFMNNPRQLSRATGGQYPVTIPNAMLGGGPLVLEPNLSAGAAVDLSNDGRPDLVLVDRQFTSRNPLTGQEFAPWVFKNDGNFHFTWIKPRRERADPHRARDQLRRSQRQRPRGPRDGQRQRRRPDRRGQQLRVVEPDPQPQSLDRDPGPIGQRSARTARARRQGDRLPRRNPPNPWRRRTPNRLRVPLPPRRRAAFRPRKRPLRRHTRAGSRTGIPSHRSRPEGRPRGDDHHAARATHHRAPKRA